MKTKYPCPCCGYSTFNQPTQGWQVLFEPFCELRQETNDFCSNCFWEDNWWFREDKYPEGFGSVQENYLKDGVVDPEYLNMAQAMDPGAKRHSLWLPYRDRIQRCKEACLTAIESAFANVKRRSGIGMRQADAIDEYKSQQEVLSARMDDDRLETTWQAIPDSDIAYHNASLFYLDPEGLRFYAPAYMRWMVRNPDADSMSGDSLLMMLDNEHKRLVSFSEAQLEAVVVFMRYLIARDSYGEALDLHIGAFSRVFWQAVCRKMNSKR